MWLPASVEGQPTEAFSFAPDRLWFWGMFDADPAPLMLQGDDNGNSFVSAVGDGGVLWQVTVDETQNLAIMGDLAFITSNDDNGDVATTTLTALSVADGSVEFTKSLTGQYRVMGLGGEVVMADSWGDGFTLARLDPDTYEPVVVATLDTLLGAVPTDRGILAWSASETLLVEPGDPWVVERWAAGGPEPDYDQPSPPVAVVGEWFVVGAGTSVRTFAHDGTAGPTAGSTVGAVSALWAPDGGHVLAVGERGLELFAVTGDGATSVASWLGAGRIGPAAIVAGRPLVVWYADGRGHVLRVADDEFTEVIGFAEEGPAAEDEAPAPEQVTFTRDAVLVSGHRDDGAVSFLTAYSPDGEQQRWTIEVPLQDDETTVWQVESGIIALVHGYALIPSELTVYR